MWFFALAVASAISLAGNGPYLVKPVSADEITPENRGSQEQETPNQTPGVNAMVTNKGIEPVLMGILKDAEESDEMRLEVLDSLKKSDIVPDNIASGLVEVLKDCQSSKVVRMQAAEVLLDTGSEKIADALPALEEELGRPEDRETAMNLLTRIGSPDALEMLEDLVGDLKLELDDADPEVRRLAVRHLGEMGSVAEKAVPEIKERLEDENADVAEAAMIALRDVDITAFDGIKNVIDIAPVWPGHPVSFDLLTAEDRQYVAYYDTDRQMTIASRELGSEEWDYFKLPERVGWDSHNGISLALDAGGHLHVAGNHHNHPLRYFRTEEAGDIQTLKRVSEMVGREENSISGERFWEGPDDTVLFAYRDGRSGDGDRIVNIYDPETRSWERLLDEPLLDGEGQRNAYHSTPVLGPDGKYHMLWVWRDTAHAETTHSPSYGRSSDLKEWETGAGEPCGPPITLESSGLVADIKPREGFLHWSLGFDFEDRPIVTYNRFDQEGNTQIYASRLEDGEWVEYQLSDWDSRWEFGGLGSLDSKVRVGGVQRTEKHGLTMTFDHWKEGSGRWVLDEESLEPVREIDRSNLPEVLNMPESENPNMNVRTIQNPTEDGFAYVLRWETLPPNRDRPRPLHEVPEPEMLRIFEVELR